MADEIKKALTLRQLKNCIDQAYERAGKVADHVEVEVWLDDTLYRVVRVGQFGVVPDVGITIVKESECDK